MLDYMQVMFMTLDKYIVVLGNELGSERVD